MKSHTLSNDGYISKSVNIYTDGTMRLVESFNYAGSKKETEITLNNEERIKLLEVSFNGVY